MRPIPPRPSLLLALLLAGSRVHAQDGELKVPSSNPPQVIPLAPPAPWLLAGNLGTNPATHFLGTIDNLPLSLRVFNLRVMRYAHAANASFRSMNVLGGPDVNSIAPGAIGATISGGGQDTFVGADYPNRVDADYGTIGGGLGNLVSAPGGVIPGGASHTALGQYSAILGGVSHTAGGDFSSIGGGYVNSTGGAAAVVGGGQYNGAGADFATVGGGVANMAGADSATVSGGSSNNAAATWATVGGGLQNNAFGDRATVAGGYINTAFLDYDTVAGGRENGATGGDSFVGGGHANQASNVFTVIGGGDQNQASGDGSTVTGGRLNAVSVRGGSIGGGAGNQVTGEFGTVPGGSSNVAQGQLSFAAGEQARALHHGAFVWADNSNAPFASSAMNEFSVRASGGTRFYSNASATTGVTLAPGAGTWTTVSDRAAKADLRPVDCREVLEHLARVPISTWSYAAQDDSVRHMGPMAQDFWAAFGLGLGERTIDTVDPDGVALAAIQGLHSIVEEQAASIAALEARLAALEAERAPR